MVSSLYAHNARQIPDRIGQNVHRPEIKVNAVDAGESSEAKVAILHAVTSDPENRISRLFTN
jgi:hypothetical protein